MSWNKRSLKFSIYPKSLFRSNSVHTFVYVPVDEHFSFAKIINPADRCGISRSWLNGTIITQVHLVLGTINGHSKMCSFVTQHNATDVWREHAIGMLTVRMSTSEFGSKSNRPHTTCMASCGRAVCWRQRCEQSAPLVAVGVMVWAGYGQQTQLQFECRDTVMRSWGPLSCHSSATIPSCFSMMIHVARSCTPFLEAENVPVFSWPAHSLDNVTH